jgi:glyoxylase-like metal-dependent hydrolase (beta-lactamase superfamily II)
VRVPDADVVLAGDLVENGAVPYFGDGFPLDWPTTADGLLALVGERTVVVPGHGDHAGRAFVEASLDGFRAVADAARRVHAGEATLEEAATLVPWPAERVVEPINRAVAQLRGELQT